MPSSAGTDGRCSTAIRLSECAKSGAIGEAARAKGVSMETRRGRVDAASGRAALFHVVLRGCRAGPLVRDEADWRKMEKSMEAMLFWCGGRILGCRCEGDRLELALETAYAPLGNMFRYLTVPYALHFNRARHERGRVFLPLRAYRLESAFKTEFVLWLHRPLGGMGWTADAAYREGGQLAWVDVSCVLGELGHGAEARRRYRYLRVRGVEEDLALAFTSPRNRTPYGSKTAGPPAGSSKRRHRTLLQSVVGFVTQHEAVGIREMTSRSRERRICRARCLVTLVGVRYGVALREIGTFLDRDGTTLQESVLRMRAREPQGLLTAVESILAAMSSAEIPDAGRVGVDSSVAGHESADEEHGVEDSGDAHAPEEED